MTTPTSPRPADVRQYLADLQWAIHSPSLLTTSAITETRPFARTTPELAGPIETSEFRVGRYFERLVEQHIRSQADWQMLACGHQIRDQGRTAGELDFVFRAGADVYHIETAVKFYLYLPDRVCRGSQFVGPNSQDNFESKTERLWNHQLPLSKQWMPEVTIRQAHVKGIIFYPRHHSVPDTLPPRLSPHHQQGTWFRAADVDDFLQSLPDRQQARFHVHHKPHWLAPPAAQPSPLDADQLTAAVDQHFRRSPGRPLMISILGASMADSISDRHCGRLFCMPDNWPETT